MDDYWDRPILKREQLVLFPAKLDEAVPCDHEVRLFDEILRKIDWADWEERYPNRRGRPPIHPRIMAGVILYGLMTRIRSSRALENALDVRLDFRWLAEGRSIDHTTLSEFRRKFGPELKSLFTKIGLLAREMDLLSLSLLAFDGTRIRANNRRSGTRTRSDLEKMREELTKKYDEFETKASSEDSVDDEAFAAKEGESSEDVEKTKKEVGRCLEQVEAALAELDRAKGSNEKEPKRVPLTDPQSRQSPNKEGGFAPNYTPLATVDVESGLIVSGDVIPGTDENHHLVAAVENVQEQFGLETPPPEMLADGAFPTGENLEAMDELGVTLYSPISIPDPATNPAVRDDPTEPVPDDQLDDLPSKPVDGKRSKQRQWTKAAFVYDPKSDCYYCPQGKTLPYAVTTSENRNGRKIVRRRYDSAPTVCENCPHRERCIQGKGKRRRVARNSDDERRESHARFMATDEAKEKYALLRNGGERPFAVIKQQFGVRRFLLRGLDQVRIEWTWLATAFNLTRLMSLIRSRAGPEKTPCVR